MANVESPEASLRRQMFMSVFPSSASNTISAPTPNATPLSAFTAPGEAFGGPSPLPAHHSQLKHSDDPVQRELIKHRAWHLVTTHFTIPKGPTKSASSLGPDGAWIQEPRGDTADALEILMREARRTPRVYEEPGGEESDLILWYMFEMDSHFHQFVLPELLLVRPVQALVERPENNGSSIARKRTQALRYTRSSKH